MPWAVSRWGDLAQYLVVISPVSVSASPRIGKTSALTTLCTKLTSSNSHRETSAPWNRFDANFHGSIQLVYWGILGFMPAKPDHTRFSMEFPKFKLLKLFMCCLRLGVSGWSWNSRSYLLALNCKLNFCFATKEASKANIIFFNLIDVDTMKTPSN